MSRNHKRGPRHDMRRVSDEVQYVPGEAITKGQILVDTGTDGMWQVMGLADNDSFEDAVSPLYLAVSDGRVATEKHLAANGVATLHGAIRDVDTSGRTLGDPVYLSNTAGGWTFTRPSTTWARKIGFVKKVHATDGVIIYDGSPPHSLGCSLIALSGNNTTSIAVGARWDGAAVAAQIRGTAADESIADATFVWIYRAYWDGSGTLTIQGNAAATSDTLISFIIYPFG